MPPPPSPLTSQFRKAFHEWIDSLKIRDLETFIGAPETQVRPGDSKQAVTLGSKDFLMEYTGKSESEATKGSWMFEIRANPKTSIPGLAYMALNSQKLPANQKRFAFLMVEPGVSPGFRGEHIKAALKECGVWEAGVINKIHVYWVPEIQGWDTNEAEDWAERHIPILPANWPPGKIPMIFEKIPFDGWNEDGSVASGSASGSGSGSGKKSSGKGKSGGSKK